MKKHILGLGIFGFIFASFAFAFAFFYVPPIPQIAEVDGKIELEKPLANNKKTSCFHKKTKLISHYVETTQLDIEKGKLISNIRLKWNGGNELPKTVYLHTKFYSSEYNKDIKFVDTIMLTNPFNDGTEKSIVIESDVSGISNISKVKNFYAEFGASDHFSNECFSETFDSWQSKQVLLVHGNSSIIKK